MKVDSRSKSGSRDDLFDAKNGDYFSGRHFGPKMGPRSFLLHNISNRHSSFSTVVSMPNPLYPTSLPANNPTIGSTATRIDDEQGIGRPNGPPDRTIHRKTNRRANQRAERPQSHDGNANHFTFSTSQHKRTAKTVQMKLLQYMKGKGVQRSISVLVPTT